MVKRLKDYGEKECPICKNMFRIKDKQKPYKFKKQICCSRKCNAEYVAKKYCTGKKAYNNKQLKRICKNCGKRQMVSPAYAKRLYCSRKCMAEDYKERQKGKKHWNWQGGITEIKARDILYDGYKEWRKKVFKRDRYKCVICGCKKSGVLNAHHIKSVKENPTLILDINNGITVCKDCHKEIHYGKKI